ncbi:hypothetical protein GUJ93_ZPchr0002g23829 [Zizania palustris]|uniref:Sugar phosphate transporter domain-containing protein n=1 Tax=Zizania palustris TaxID=103762 RepID=A0A8J5S3U6_ZIZPA|nr:hypothetical protein GUJ93_ZPchr0002g23829 [Zizania palustris]
MFNVVTSMGIIMVNKALMGTHGFSFVCSSITAHTAPAQSASLLILGPFLDFWLTNKRVGTFNYTTIVTFLIVLSCIIAVGTNLSQLICIERFTAVSFQVLGHMKMILVLTLGFLFFGKEGLDFHVVLGMMLAVIGMIWCCYCSMALDATDNATIVDNPPTDSRDAALARLQQAEQDAALAQ